MTTALGISKPEKTEYPEWFAGEIELVHYAELRFGLQESFMKTLDFLRSIPENKLDYRYADGKWTLREIWQHVLDVERILTYRALRYSRQDKTVLHGFDENSYAVNSRATMRGWDEIIIEYIAVRDSTISLFRSFTPEMVLQTGTAGKSTLSVRAVGYLILGHEIHHTATIRQLYL